VQDPICLYSTQLFGECKRDSSAMLLNST